MPCVAAPVLDVAGGFGTDPCVDGIGQGAGICCVVPGALPAVALESVDHRVAVGHDLIHIHLDISDRTGRGGEVNPVVVEEVGGGFIVTKGYVVELAAVVEELGLKHARSSADRWRVDGTGGADGAAAGSLITGVLPVAQGLDSPDANRVAGHR